MSIIMIAVTDHESRSAEQSNQAVKRRQLSIPRDGVESTYLQSANCGTIASFERSQDSLFASPISLQDHE